MLATSFFVTAAKMPSVVNDDRYNDNKYVRERLRKLFELAQEQTGNQNLVDKCKKMYQKCENTDMFLEEFITILRYCLIYPEKTAVERMLSFVAKFVVVLYCNAADKEDTNNSNDSEEDNTEIADSFANGILEFLYKSHSASSVDVRLRCVTLLNKILSTMPENSTISDSMWTKLTETVISRIQDKSPVVRVQAVLTARKLQNPKDADCEIMKALIFHLNDPSSAVRRTVVSSIALNKLTIAYVLARTRDVNENVRRHAYIVFSKVKVLNITIKYRTTILERGLQDRSEMVRDCVRKFVVINWLENFNKDIIKFLEALDVVNCSDIAILTLESIFRTIPMEEVLNCLPIDEETRLIPTEKLTPESVLLWRCLAHFFQKEERDEELETILPNLVIFCDFVKNYYPLDKNSNLNLSTEEQWAEVKEKQILLHLIHLAKVFDLSDEMGRSALKKLIIAMLTSFRISDLIGDCLIELLVQVVPGTEAFLQELTEVISEVREPLNQIETELPYQQRMELELKRSDLKVMLNDLKEREYNAVQNKDYVEAQKLKDEIDEVTGKLEELCTQPVVISQEVREEKNDPVTVCKCLSILVQMIKCSGVKTLTPTLRSLKDNFLNHCLSSNDLLTQSLAIQALGQFCVLDKNLAKENLFRFMLMITENGDNEINIPALKSVFDIIHTHGIESFENLDETQDLSDSKAKSRTLLLENEDYLNVSIDTLQNDATLSGAKCISLLKELLNCKSNEAIKVTAFEGLCKLLISGVVYSSSVLTKIIVKGFSPIVENETEDFIRQVFMVFFPIFASTTPRSQEMIESAFIPTLRTIANASLGSPEADINIKDVLTFLIEHTKPDINKFTSKTLHVHNNLCLALCHEVLRDPAEEPNLSLNYIKALLQLDISLDSESYLQQLQTLRSKLENEFAGHSAFVKVLRDFGKKVNDRAQITLQSVENTLATTDNETRTSKGTSTGDDVTNSTITTAATRNSSVSTIRSLRSTRKRRTTQESLSIVSESPENSQMSGSNESFNTPTNKRVATGGIVPESPELSDDSS